MNDQTFRFRPKARILRLLGDQLIGSPRLAIFELVKNAYDADAEEVSISLDALGTKDACIAVQDDGEGMSADIVRDVWFVPGADHREKQRAAGIRTRRFHRLPLGEKGLGRFAVHKLGDKIRLVTRARGAATEIVVDIDWNRLLDDRFLENLEVIVVERVPEHFSGSTHGTLVEIRDLRESKWTRGDVRRLYRQVTSICSPFVAGREFNVTLDVPGRAHDLDGLPTVADILEAAFWQFSFSVRDGHFAWSYEFVNRLSGVDLEGRKSTSDSSKLVLDDQADEAAEEVIPRPHRRRSSTHQQVAVDAEFLKGIGVVEGDLFIYDRDREVLERLSESASVTQYLNENGGIRVYRDGIRVYNYGERGDDWLGLDLRRVNQPSRRISRNVVVGAINLDLSQSQGLVEKTNREGFVENESYARFRRIVLAAITEFEAEREKDKERLRAILGKKKGGTERFDADPPIDALRREARKHGVETALSPYISRIQREFDALKDTLVHAGMSGIGLAVVFHEIDRGVRELYSAVKGGGDSAALEQKAKELSQLLDGFSVLLRRTDKQVMSASEIVRRARDVSVARFRFHGVKFECPLLADNVGDFDAVMARGLLLGALTNLFDNAIYWLRVRWPDDGSEGQRQLYVGTSNDLDGGPAIVVADNGPGFRDAADLLTKPFFTRRPDGMGLGLYYVKLAMELSGGTLQFPDPQDLGLPAVYDGAVIALVFKTDRNGR